MKSPSPRRAVIFLVFSVFVIFYLSKTLQWSSDKRLVALNYSQLASNPNPCRFPKIFPEPSSIPTKFTPVLCAHHKPDLVRIEGSSIISILPSNSCVYQEVTFISDFSTQTGSTAKPLPHGESPCPAEVFYVTCTNKGNVVMKNRLLRCVIAKDMIKRRLQADTAAENKLFEEHLNILMFGLDSVSRVAWMEQLQKTNAFTRETLNGIAFEGYNIVGDGTTAAFLGITTGYMEEELHESRRGFYGATPVDNFPFIWRQLSEEAGYTTLWDEDGPSLGTFHYRLLGFRKPPVDYYGRLFQLTLEQGYPKDACLGAMPAFQEMLRQFRQLFKTYPDPFRKFAMVFNSHYTHTSSGSGNLKAYTVDHLLRDELKWLFDNGKLNNSLFILFSDHGSRFGGSRATYRGKVAERLPYLNMIFPEWFKRKYPAELANLKTAAEIRLTTPFDLHATLLDVGGLGTKPGTPPRGLSMFRGIPSNRNCEDAGVLPHWCACLDDQNVEVPLNDPLVTKCLEAFSNYVNTVLLKSVIASSECLPITAERPFMARRVSLRKEVKEFVKTVDGHGRKPGFDPSAALKEDFVQLSFHTSPGNGQFEVTFFNDKENDVVSVLPKQISRINPYGSAPWCIQDRFPHLRQFCFCANRN